MDKKKLTPEQQFFNDTTLEFAEELYNQNEVKINEAYKSQKENRDNILIEIAKVLLSYKIADSILNITSKEKTKIYSNLSNLITKSIKSELASETKLTKNILTGVGKEKYNVNNYVYSLGTDFKETQLSDKNLDRIINTKVEDKLWSDRLYDNKNQIAKTLRNEVKKFLNGDTNVNDIEKVIKDKYNTNAYETKRLVQDNICRVQEGINDEWQHEHDIKYVMYMATLDGHVCPNCAQYDAKVFELDKKPVIIPQHPFCRCVYISLINKDWHPKMRLDNETKENINWQSYQEWKENGASQARADKYITNVTDGKKIDTIQPINVFKELNKSQVGKDTIKYIEDNNLNIEFKYNNIIEGVRGIAWGEKQIEIYIPNTKTKLLTTQTLIHEVTHLKYNIRDTQWAETVCFLKEKEHIKGTLTIQDKRDTIRLVKGLYPELPWR